jgi:hypothetical protein
VLYCTCSIAYGPEVPEWKMEKHRFYCELPGDIWEDGYFMQLVRDMLRRRHGFIHMRIIHMHI